MPNWCSNRATITGPRQAIEDLTRAATYTDEYGNQEIRFAELIPMPKILGDIVSSRIFGIGMSSAKRIS